MRLIQPIDPTTTCFVWEPPRIHTQRNRRVLVPHLTAHVRYRLACVDEERAERVTHLMWTALVQPGLGEDLIERFADVRLVEGRAGR